MRKNAPVLFFVILSAFIFFLYLFSSKSVGKEINQKQTSTVKQSNESDQKKAIISTNKKQDFIREQIKALEKEKKLILNSLCEQADKDELNEQFQANLQVLIDALDIADKVYNLEDTINSQTLEKTDNSFTYKSKIFPNTLIKRSSSHRRVGKNSLKEEFTFNGKKIELLYRKDKTSINLVRVQVTNKEGNQAITTLPNDYHVFNPEYDQSSLIVRFGDIYNTLLNNLQIRDAGHNRYTLYYGGRQCYDKNGKEIQPFLIEERSKEPTEFLLWYEGTISKYPIKAMMKMEFTNSRFIHSDMFYGYDKYKKLILLQQDKLYQNNEKIDFTDASFNLNKTLQGKWSREENNTKKLDVTLQPLYKPLPQFVFKAKVKVIYNAYGKPESETIQALDVVLNEQKTQTINLDNNSFELAYADINYDGYLDLIVGDNFYLFDKKSNTFTPHDLETDWFNNIKDLYSYNIFDKSYTTYNSRHEIEYRAINGKVKPYLLHSSHINESDEVVSTTSRYINGKWEQVSEEGELYDE